MLFIKDTHKCCHDTRKKKEDKTEIFIKGKKILLVQLSLLFLWSHKHLFTSECQAFSGSCPYITEDR